MKVNWKGLIEWTVDRLCEPSTYLGIGGLIASAGFANTGHTVAAAGAGVASALGIVLKEGGVAASLEKGKP